MRDPPNISDSLEGQMLDRLAGLALELAITLQQRAMATESDADAAKLATAFHRISRSVRQSIALKAKLHFDQQAHERVQKPLREKARQAAVSRRHTQVYRALERIIWDEADDAEIAREMSEDLRECLDFEVLDDGFLDEPLPQQIDRIKKKFDLIGPEPAADETAPHPAEVPAEDVDHYESGDLSWNARIGRPSLDDGLHPDSS